MLLQKHSFSFVMRKYRHEVGNMSMASHLNFFKDQRSTVIIGDFYEDVARIVMCEAYRNNMTSCYVSCGVWGGGCGMCL